MATEHVTSQLAICSRFGTEFVECPEDRKVGISTNVLDGILPINGVRCSPEGDTTGWYIWAGEEMSEDDEFFKPLHVAHLEQWCPQIIKYLGLPPGWRFLVAGSHEDVWFDENL